MLNRRALIRSAAGLLLAAGAGEVLLPERTVFALDRTMLGRPLPLMPAQVGFFTDEDTAPGIPAGDPFARMLEDAYLREKKRLEEAIFAGDWNREAAYWAMDQVIRGEPAAALPAWTIGGTQ